MDKKLLIKQAGQLQNQLVDIRRYLHFNAESGNNLKNTRKFIIEKLTSFGYSPKESEGGITAILKGKEDGKCILLRADMDGLKIKENTDLDFRSTNGCMHGCGHDMHTSMLLGAAKLLKQYQDEIKGSVKFVFQDDEEGFTGAKKMLNEGVLDNPHVDAAFAMHVHSGTPTGTILYAKEYMMASCTLFKVTINGKSAHGAMPENGIDPITIACNVVLSLQEIISREIEACKPAVLTIGKIEAGTAPNIIPSSATILGSIRCFDNSLTDYIVKRIDEISNSIAKAFRGSAKCEILASAPSLYNDVKLTDKFISYLKDSISNPIYDISKGGMGSEDFASYTYKVPSLYILIGAGSEKEDKRYGKPMHNECVVFNEDILSLGSYIHSIIALSYLNEK